MLQVLLPHGQDVLMTAAFRAELEGTLAELQAAQQERDAHGANADEPQDAGTSLFGRIALAEQALAQAQIVDEDEDRAVVGTIVEVDDGRKRSRYELTVLAPAEDPPGAIAVSITSPVGAALHGVRVDDTATVSLPDGRRRELRVLSIGRSA